MRSAGERRRLLLWPGAQGGDTQMLSSGGSGASGDAHQPVVNALMAATGLALVNAKSSRDLFIIAA